MDISNIYNVYFEEDNIIYSLDMIRLKTYFSVDEFYKIEFFFQTVHKDKIKKMWTSHRVMCFKYNYVIEVEEGKSFYFGFFHNNEKKDYSTDGYNFTIEFNPNKLKDNSLLMYILNKSGRWFIKSYDVAFDLKISILDIITDMSGRNIEKIDSRGYDNKTITVGKGDGRFKIYNKKIESNLPILGDLTRIEISREIDDFEIRKVVILEYDGNFPTVYTNNYLFSFSDYKDKTLLAILYAVQNGFPIRDLSRAYRKKIKNLLEGGYKVKFDRNIVTILLRKTLFFYFMQNKKVIWL